VLRVADVMRTHVHQVAPDASVRTAAHRMLLLGIESLVVVEDDRPVGIVTERDILAAAMPRMDELVGSGLSAIDVADVARAHFQVPVREVMTHAIETTTSDTTVTKALGAMLARRLRRLPVQDPGSGRLVGIVTQRDLLGLIYLDAHDTVATV